MIAAGGWAGGKSKRSPPWKKILFGGPFPSFMGVFFSCGGSFVLLLGCLASPFVGHFLHLGDFFCLYVEKYLDLFPIT